MKSAPATLEKRIERLEDLEAIRYLVNRYHTAINEHDYGSILPLFTEQAVVILVDDPPLHGHKEIEAGFLRRLGRLKIIKQFIHGLQIDLDEDAAKAYCYLDARYARNNDPSSYVIAGKLLYSFAKRDGEWLMDRYQVTLFFVVPLTKGWSGDKLMY